MLDEFRNYLMAQGKSENTVASYCLAVGAYLRWYAQTFGEEMVKLYRANVLDYLSYLRTLRGLANNSVNARLAALQNLNEFLISTGAQTDAVLTKKDYLKVQQPYANPSTVSMEQVEAFRQKVLVMKGKRNYAIVTILAYAGLRISECLDLAMDDVNLVAGEITVRHGKGDKARVVYVGDKVINAVREYKRERPDSDSPYLFLSRNGGRLSRGQVNKIFNEFSAEITPHTLRHFFCSTAMDVGYAVDELANQAGHSNIHTTLRYTNPTRETMKKKANLL